MYAADGGSRSSMIEPAPCFGAEPAEGTPMRAFNETKTVRGSCLFGTQLAKGRSLRAFIEPTTLRGSCLFGTAACEGTPHAGLRGAKLRPADVCDVESRPDSPPSEAAARRAIAHISPRDETCGAPISTDAGLRGAKLRPPRYRVHVRSGRSLRSARIDRCGPPRAEASARRSREGSNHAACDDMRQPTKVPPMQNPV